MCPASTRRRGRLGRSELVEAPPLLGAPGGAQRVRALGLGLPDVHLGRSRPCWVDPGPRKNLLLARVAARGI